MSGGYYIVCPWCGRRRPREWIQVHLQHQHPEVWAWIVASGPVVVDTAARHPGLRYGD